ncbi:MAG: DUF58 domain-containing protein [Planctomycetota bacterium]
MKEILSRSRFLAGALALALFAHLFSFPYLALVGWTAFFVLLSSRLLVRYWIAHLSVERSFPLRKGRIGDAARGTVKAENTGRLPVPFLILREHVDPGVKFQGARSALGMLLPGRTMELLYTVTFEKRGYFQFGPAGVETGDLFGFFKRFRSTGGSDHALIYPKTLVLSRYDVASRRPIGELRITHRLFEDPLLVASVREYRPGDPLRHIHWKASARTGVLQTKIFDPTTVIGATVVLDFDRARYGANPVGVARSELAVTLAASVAYHVYSKREKVGFLTNGSDAAERMRFAPSDAEASARRDALSHGRPARASGPPTGMLIPTRRSEEQATRILEALARVELSEGFPLEQLLATFAPRLPRDASLIVITEHVDGPLAACLESLRAGAFAVRVLCVTDPTTYRASLSALASAGIDSQLVADEGDMNEIAIRGI